MLGIVIVAHGELAREYLSAGEYVVGFKTNIKTISVYPSDNINQKEEQIKEALHNVDCGDGTIIVTDMHGSTPANLALKAAEGFNCEVLFGANLPLVVKLIKVRNLSASEAVTCALNAGKKYVNCANSIYKK